MRVRASRRVLEFYNQCHGPADGRFCGKSMTAAAFGRQALERSNAAWSGGKGVLGAQNAWLHQDGSVTPVEHHEDNDGYTQATLHGRVRIIAMPHRGELTIDSSLLNGTLTPRQITAIRVMFAQTKARNLYVGVHVRARNRGFDGDTVLRGPTLAEVSKVLNRLNEALNG